MQNTNQLRFEFSKVLSLKAYPGYTSSLEFSDKIVLPLHICHTLVRSAVHFPPIFSVSSPYTSPFLCGVLEYSSVPDTVYFPQHLLKRLGLDPTQSYSQSTYHTKGVFLQVLMDKKEKHPFPKLKQLEIHLNVFLTENICKRGLLGYSTVKSGDILNVTFK